MTVKTIYLAGGCFWGTEAYLKRIPGVLKTQVGYANSIKENPSYEEVCTGATQAAEAVRVDYDAEVVPLPLLLEAYLASIDPWSVNKQGNDCGTQYRTGIYYVDPADETVVTSALLHLLTRSLGTHTMGSATTGTSWQGKKLAVESGLLGNFYAAEDYHQDYLGKNPGGYCHVNLSAADEFVKVHELDFAIAKAGYAAKDKAALKEELDELAWEVTQHAATEMPHTSEYDQNFERGIYVDKTSGQPLFSSRDKFDAGCGWPSFSRPLADSLIQERADDSLVGRPRIEVKSELADAHLGHVFGDGPSELGGLRYCINGAALEFVPESELEARGLGYLRSEL